MVTFRWFNMLLRNTKFKSIGVGDGQTKIGVCSDEPFLEASSGIAKLSHLSFFLEKAAAAWYASSCSGFNSSRNKRGR